MQFLTLGWMVLELTNSASRMGFMIFLYGLPTLAFVLFGGIFADRFDRADPVDGDPGFGGGAGVGTCGAGNERAGRAVAYIRDRFLSGTASGDQYSGPGWPSYRIWSPAKT